MVAAIPVASCKYTEVHLHSFWQRLKHGMEQLEQLDRLEHLINQFLQLFYNNINADLRHLNL